MCCMHRLMTRPMLALAGAAALLLGAGAFFVFGTHAPDARAVAAHPTPSPSVIPSPSDTSSPSPTPSASETPAALTARCPLSGQPMDDPRLAARTALVVQIENHPLARPARNLNRADMVVEAPVEGDITRFSAVFLCQPTEGLTGPVRSARYYNIDLWQDLHVLTVGFGASGGALARFEAASMPYVNGILGGWPWYQRIAGREAPHNLYADIERVRSSLGSFPALDRLAERAGALRPPFHFDPAVTLPSGRAVASLEIKTNAYWRFGWTWDGGLKAWRRQDAGAGVVDAVDGQPLTAGSVIVQRVSQEVVYGDPDPGGNSRRLQHLVGSGDGTLYVAGEAIALHWSRPKAADGTRWTYASGGAAVVLPPGRVWWEIVPTGASVTER